MTVRARRGKGKKMDESVGGPYIKAALLCERVLVERDNVHTLVRVIDRFITQIPPGQGVKPVPVKFYLVLMFTSGFAHHKMKVRADIVSPNGGTITSITNDVLFQGEDQGCNIIGEVNMEFHEEGLYWIEISLDEQLQTRVPLRWIVQQTTVAGPAPPNPENTPH